MQRITCYDAASGKIKNRVRGRHPVDVKCLTTILFYVCDVALFLSTVLDHHCLQLVLPLPVLTYDTVVVVAANFTATIVVILMQYL